jgi:predicted 3-demethylubiquinone-9 3-methyltransferase (glyoxalase superfamily)
MRTRIAPMLWFDDQAEDAAYFYASILDNSRVTHVARYSGAPAQCGWLKDRFGLSWQVVPTELIEMLKDPDAAAARQAFEQA